MKCTVVIAASYQRPVTKAIDPLGEVLAGRLLASSRRHRDGLAETVEWAQVMVKSDASVTRAWRHAATNDATLIVLAVGLLSLGFSLWQLSVPGYLTFYDTGVYLAASIHLVSGVVPYRDFVFVQPPGLVVLLSPLGAVGRIFGAHDAFVVGRVVSAIVTAGNASLVTWLVRGRGRVAMVIAGVGLALLPVVVLVSTSVNLEPYCVLFILWGAAVLFGRDERTKALSSKALVGAGVLFGVAGLVKLWAVFPLLAVVVCLVPRYRARVTAFVGAAGATFVVGCAPFFALAPHNFFSEVIVEQLARRANGTDTLSLAGRLVDLSGFATTSVSPSTIEAVVVFVVLAVLVAFAFTRRLHFDSADAFFLLAAVLTIGGLLVAPETYDYYYYFTAPFLLGLVGVTLARLTSSLPAWAKRLRISSSVRRLVLGALGVSVVVVIIGQLLYVTTFYSYLARDFGVAPVDASRVASYIPEGACVIYVDVGWGVIGNRLAATNPDCPVVVDPIGMWMAHGYQNAPPTPAFSAQWESYFKVADDVVLYGAYNDQFKVGPHTFASTVPWSPGLTAWFKHHYRLHFECFGLYIYQNDAAT